MSDATVGAPSRRDGDNATCSPSRQDAAPTRLLRQHRDGHHATPLPSRLEAAPAMHTRADCEERSRQGGHAKGKFHRAISGRLVRGERDSESKNSEKPRLR